MQQAINVEVIIPTLVAQEQPDVVDIFLEKKDEGNASPEQQAPVDDVEEEIEVEKADPSPPRDLQAEPPNQTRKRLTRMRGDKCFARQIHPGRIIWCPYPDGC